MEQFWYQLLRDILSFLGGASAISFTLKIIIKKTVTNKSNSINKNFKNSNDNKDNSININESKDINIDVKNGIVNLSDLLPALKENNNDMLEKFTNLIETKKNENFKDIVHESLKNIDSNSIPIDLEWMNRFYDYSSKISDKQLQKMWSSLLSGQTKKENTFSLKTLDIVRNLTTEDIILFKKIANYVINDHWIYETVDQDLNDYIPFTEILHLTELGIIRDTNLLINTFKIPGKGNFFIKSDKHMILMENPTNTEINIQLHGYIITKSGVELLSMTSHTADINYLKDTTKLIRNKNFSLNVGLYKIDHINPDGSISFNRANIIE